MAQAIDMYEINTRDALGFVADPTIDLPRFQRASTWNRRQRFNLAVSTFHGYPLGMVVVRQQDRTKEGKRQRVSYLLDGRQRRETLEAMRNPENIWDWAKGVLKFKNSDKAQDIAPKFWNHVDDYFGREAWQESDSREDVSSYEEEEELIDASMKTTDLQALLDVILAVHPVSKPESSLAGFFNFSNHLTGLPYFQTSESGQAFDVDVPSLLLWMRNLREHFELRRHPYPPTRDDFVEFLVMQAGSIKSSREDLERDVDARLTNIRDAFDALDEVDDRLRQCDLGYLEIKNCTANDEKKIFEIINSAGTQLTAVEILSAKHQWNIEVDDPVDPIRANAAALYADALEIHRNIQEVVRWDVAATVLDRLETDPIIGRGSGFEDLTKGQFERRVTLGFKLLAGRHLRRITKEDLSKLGYDNDVPWHSAQFEKHANQVHDALLTHCGLYKFWASWNTSLNDRTSDAAAMNYLLLMVENWLNRGKPKQQGSERDGFLRDARTLLDRTIYEYVTDVWAGSSDSRIARNLRRYNSGSDTSVFESATDEAWEVLAREVVEDGAIGGESYLSSESRSADPRIVLLALYANVVRSRRGPDRPWAVDHIIPRRLFRSASSQYRRYMHHIANLGLIPVGENLVKGDDSLAVIHGLQETQEKKWLVQEISRYTDIPFDRFPDFSKASHVEELREFRGPKLIEALTTTRAEVVDATG